MKVAPSPSEMTQRVKSLVLVISRLAHLFLIENIILIEGLKHNLVSISQLYDKDLKVVFDDFTCDILDKKTNTCVLFDFCENNVYMIDMLNLQCNATCLNVFNKDS